MDTTEFGLDQLILLPLMFPLLILLFLMVFIFTLPVYLVGSIVWTWQDTVKRFKNVLEEYK